MSALLDSGTRKKDSPAPPGRKSVPELTPERARTLLAVAFRPALFALIVITVVVVATLMFAHTGFTGVAGAIAACWLGVHQVQLTIGTTPLGVLPLLPTAALLWLVGRGCARAAKPDATRLELGWIAGAAVGGPLLVTAICLAVVKDASSVIALAPPDTLAAFAWVIVLHAVAAAVGIASTRRNILFTPDRFPDWAIAGGVSAARGLQRLLVVGAGLTLVTLVLSWSTLADTVRGSDGFVGAVALVFLSICYLPNVIVGAAAVLVGASVHVGGASVDLFGVVGGPVPAVPVMAALPSGPAAIWWPVLLLVPAVIAVLVGRDCARTCPDRREAVHAAVGAAALMSIGVVLLALSAGGDLGEFGHVGVSVALAGTAVFGWIAVVGSAAAVLESRRAASADVPGTHEKPDQDLPENP